MPVGASIKVAGLASMIGMREPAENKVDRNLASASSLSMIGVADRGPNPEDHRAWAE